MAGDVTQVFNTSAIAPSTTANGYVSDNRPAPAGFDDPVYVVLPEFSTVIPFECKWGAIHGATRPAPGAEVTVVFDARNRPNVVYWEGQHS